VCMYMYVQLTWLYFAGLGLGLWRQPKHFFK
jgi:hypothetical protein